MDTPNPSIDWGDGTTTDSDWHLCTDFACFGGDLWGTHNYGAYGTYHVRRWYYTGCCVSYDATTVSAEGASLSVTNTGACTDNAGNAADPVTFGPIEIDKTPPTVTGNITPDSIWPPNHKLVPIAVTVNVNDGGPGPADFVLISATASGGASDIQGVTVGQASTSGQVRANEDEVYILTSRGTDTVGNTATLVLTVRVPHDQGRP